MNPPDDPSHPILVTGATGRHGGTGPLIVRLLCERGFAVRAMGHRDDERLAALKALGAETVIGDFSDIQAMIAAMKGVRRAYFCYPVAAGIVTATATFAAAGKAAGLETVVSNSMGAAHPLSPSALARAQWLSEQILNWAGFKCAHLRGGFFYENILLLSEETIARDGLIENPFGSGSMTLLAGEDMARAAAELLARETADWPAPDPVSRVLWLTGEERLNFTEIAGILTGVLGRPVRYEMIPDSEWRERLAENARVPAEMAEHLAGLVRVSRSGRGMPLDSGVVRELVGRPPVSLAGFLAPLRDRLGARTGDSPAAVDG